MAGVPYKPDERTPMLTLRGVDYGNIFCAPGARGFFGEGYPFHRLATQLGMTWEGTGFVSKTITYPPRDGNMPLQSDRLTPRERFIPRSIVIKPWSGHVLNAVGLSGPGAEWAFDRQRWQARTDAFMISFMSVAASPDERIEETKLLAELLARELPNFRGQPALQFNRACPNTGHPPDEFFAETDTALDVLAGIGVPVVVNYNVVAPVEVLQATAEHPACDALWIANTVPWGDRQVDWKAIFGSDQSPLAKRNLPIAGGGGLSGPACLSLTVETVRRARQAGIGKPIVAGNGIQRAYDVMAVKAAGADAIAIGTVGIVRPWRMRRIIEKADWYFGQA